MYTIFLGGISLYDYDFATGALTSNAGLPFVDDVTTLEQTANGDQEYEMPDSFPAFTALRLASSQRPDSRLFQRRDRVERS